MLEHVKALEHAGFQFEAADASFELLLRREAGVYEPLFVLESWRVIVEQHGDSEVKTEATIKIRVDGKRIVRHAEGNGPVNALDAALRQAISERHPHLADIDLVNYKVRILDETKGTGAVTRVLIDSSDGHDSWGSIGVHENVIAASWQALVDSLAYAEQPSRVTALIPLARPVLGAREEELVLEVLRSGMLSLGPMLPRFEADFAAKLGVAHASRGLERHRGLHLALRAAGVKAGDEVITSPFSFIASANAPLYEGARPVFADIDPVTLNLDPDAARAAVTERTTALLPVHIFGAPADVPAFESFGLPIVEDACEALGARHDDGTVVGSRGHAAVFAFYANKQMTTGEGGIVVCSAEAKERIDSERNQGRAPDMGWLDHDRLGFNYRMTDLQCALGIAQLERLDDMLAARARVAGWYGEALADIEGIDAAGRDRGRAAGSSTSSSFPRGVDRDATIVALRDRGVQSKPYLPAIHLFAFYRERFGHRPGEFPVAEDVAARSIALPFFPALTQGEVEEVAQTLRAVLQR